MECPVGTFHNFLEKICSPCPFGTYQFKGGQLSCVVCPDHTSTAGENSKSAEDCKPQCVPGMFSKYNGVIPCETCPLVSRIPTPLSEQTLVEFSILNMAQFPELESQAEYQTQYGSKSCRRCPAGMTTLKRRSFQLRDCKARCPPHSASRFGIVPCHPCPAGYQQPLEGQKGCVSANGQLNNSSGCFVIQLPIQRNRRSSYLERRLVIDWSLNVIYTPISSTADPSQNATAEYLPFNACFSAPCKNNGTCSPMDKHFSCNCLPGYTGTYCEKRIDECALLPCGQNATCVLGEVSGYTCFCPAGVRGANCNEDIDECASHTCRNGATCINTFGSFQCICTEGFTGESTGEFYGVHSSKRIRKLFPITSIHHASGPTCEEDIDECRPPEAAGQADARELSSICRNGGRCVNLPGSFRCDCLPEFTGRHCERLSCGCLNGGNCSAGRCVCPAGFRGAKCEQLSSKSYCEAVKPCLNGGTCRDVDSGGFR